ncbi:DUF1508 domain-containing protein [Mesorhizobium sp. M0220]
MYKDNQRHWRWTFHAKNGEPIGVSSEAYENRVDCRHSITLMQGSGSTTVWLPGDPSNAQ